MVSVVIAWVSARPGITPGIIGASRPEQLDSSLPTPAVGFVDELRKACDQAWWSLPRRPVVEGYR